MRLPKAEKAYIPARKLEGYLLSETHSAGRSKAKFFRGLGFNETNVLLLERGLLRIARGQDVSEVEDTVHGMKYAVEGELSTPAGYTTRVKTIWIIDQGQDRPRFVTAYPA